MPNAETDLEPRDRVAAAKPAEAAPGASTARSARDDAGRPRFSLLRCRICWRINAVVFTLILLIEALILAPSASRFEGEQHMQRSERALQSISAAIAATAGPEHLPALESALSRLVASGTVVGAGVYSLRGAPLVRVGEPLAALTGAGARALPIAPAAAGAAAPLRLLLDAAAERAEYVASDRFAGRRVLLAARLDTAPVQAALTGFLWRIGGLVLLIVGFVSLGTMIVVYAMVMRPLLRLHRSLRHAAEHPDRVELLETRPGHEDEFDEIFATHNDMLERLAASRRRDRELAEERARYIAQHEPLTGLPNRAGLLSWLQRRAAPDAEGAGLAVLMVNLVEFGLLNASLGQTAGDEVLLDFSRRLRAVARSGDFVAHLGADGFVLVADPIECPDDAAQYAERLIRDVGKPMRIGAHDVKIAVRVGIAFREARPFAVDQLIGEGELALARARSEGGARYQFFLPSLGEEARLRQRLARELELALERDQFQLAFQPKVDARSDPHAPRLTGAEALLRWAHPELGQVRPDAFIAVAESTGLIIALGEHVFRMVCDQIVRWRGQFGAAPVIAVNVSALQFNDPDLTTRLARVLAAAGLEPRAIDIEVTETAAMADADRTAAVLQSLRALGVSVSIDDFGTGYSSLAYLRRFPIDAIKIDKSFVEDIGSDPAAESLCAALIGLAKSLGLGVVAEGVEACQQLEFLRARGCDQAQGYLFSRPVAASEFARRFLAPASGRVVPTRAATRAGALTLEDAGR